LGDCYEDVAVVRVEVGVAAPEVATSQAPAPLANVYVQNVGIASHMRSENAAWTSTVRNAAPAWYEREDNNKMRVIVTTTTGDLDASVDPRFGRGAYFLLVDTDSWAWEGHINGGMDAAGGAGTLAAQFAASHHVEAVLSGDFGPNAYTALTAAGIRMHLTGASRTARDAVALFKAGMLQEVRAPTAAGHHGSRPAR
jgi:predicted Fe-Mo cluster-binding NifX family protein